MGLVKGEEEKSIILHMNIISILMTNLRIHNIFIGKDKNIGFYGYIGTWILRIYWIYQYL